MLRSWQRWFSCLPYRHRREWFLLPIITYAGLFALFPKFPDAIKRTPDVVSLPTADQFLFGRFPHQFLSGITHPWLDYIAAFVYQLHFLLPFLFLSYQLRYQKKRIHDYVHCFGWLCLLGGITQLIMPTAPPWYYDKYGTADASYEMKGDPARLADVDLMLGISWFRGIYRVGTIVFGSFPSLHAAWPCMIALFEPHFFTWCYTGLVWWAALYLHHHYFIDVLGGAAYCLFVYRMFGEPGKASTHSIEDNLEGMDPNAEPIGGWSLELRPLLIDRSPATKDSLHSSADSLGHRTSSPHIGDAGAVGKRGDPCSKSSSLQSITDAASSADSSFVAN